jgi:hypothetical protein
MIIRVFRARVCPGKIVAFREKVERLSIPLVRSAGGMIGYCPRRLVGSYGDEFVMATIWNTVDALRVFAGDDWERAVIPPEELPLLEETVVHRYELFGPES